MFKKADTKLQSKLTSVIHNYWELFYDITTTPLLLQNVWGCSKTCQPNESGFFRLLNFRGKLHSSTHVQEVSPNCSGCLLASRIDGENFERNETYVQCFLLLEYINHITKIVSEKNTEEVRI